MGQSTNTNYLFSVSNTFTKLQYDPSSKIFTNDISIQGSLSFLTTSNVRPHIRLGDQNTNNGVSVDLYSTNYGLSAILAGDPTRALFTVSNWFNIYYFQAPNIDATNAFYSMGVPGITTNINVAGLTNTGVAGGGYKTNRLMFSGGILTNVINNY